MATIEERLKAIEEKLGIEQNPVAGWYITDNTGVYLAFSDGKTLIYGFDYQNNWFYTDRESLDFSDNYYKPADPKEVAQRLIEEAERRGFKKGVKFNCLFSGLPRKVNKLIYRIDHFNSDRVLDSDIGLIFNKGKWAEIIEEPLTLNGKIIDYDIADESVIINNEVFKVSDLKQLLTKIEQRENR